MKFPAGRIPFEYEREDLAKVVREVMERRDTNIVGGNISIRVKDEDGKDYYVMTPTMMSEAYLGHLTADQILVIEPHTRKVVSGNGKATREINMHEAIYDTNQDIKCVFHSHADRAMFWATSGLNMPNVTEATQKLKEIRTLKWHPMCTEELAQYVATEIKNIGDKALRNGFLLNSHGTLFTSGGKNMDPLTALHKSLADVDITEYNAQVAYDQTIFQQMGVLDGYYSEDTKIGTWEDVKNGKALYNKNSSQNKKGD
ncbi:aldolase [Bombilactobacillus bombi]|uniref:Aldolase n=1 Tax=Bombilactobacillus bombi TaxID=1303590 RepID=A0A347ST76_9LACO|nr:class II aldolase/adducin family protein [Bombilactobacillus bombi]AXX65235.1 aldolase [Bombilactobacillus bombi]MCO6542088.1 class II aldolase/adducin family protein [Lactobacillus sp.]RHW46304.1 aldolase [Bombilactobacillus bombi]